MPPLTFIANPYSMHVGIWVDAARACELEVQIETAEREGAESAVDTPVRYLVPRQVPGPSILRYLWAGVAARFRRRHADEILHAHCSSGNGLVAWLSGHPYIVTTYGSEVLAAGERGWLYQWLLRRVLQGAQHVTATSPQMVEVLTDRFEIPAERIHLFDLGLDTRTFCPASAARREQRRAELGVAADEPVWVAVKRAVPMNRTLEMVQAFLQYADAYPAGHFVVLCGNADDEYVRRIKQRLDQSHVGDRVILVEDWLEADDVAGWLQIADFALSVPTWDQMSNAVLEGMACGAVPILARIGGYCSLEERSAPVCWLDEVDVTTLASVLAETGSLPEGECRRQQREAFEFIQEYYANRRVWEVLQPLYNLPSRPDAGELRAA